MKPKSIQVKALSFLCDPPASRFEVTVDFDLVHGSSTSRMQRAIKCTDGGNSILEVEQVPIFGGKARTSLQLFALLAAIAVRRDAGGLSGADLRGAVEWGAFGSDDSAAARVRQLLGDRARQSGGRWIFSGDVSCEFTGASSSSVNWLWPPPQSSPLDLIKSAALLFKSGEKLDRKRADELAQKWAAERKLPLEWLLGGLHDRCLSREERAIVACAIGAHPEANDTALAALLLRLSTVGSDGTVYAYRVLHSARELLIAGRCVNNPEHYIEHVAFFEETGGKETTTAARAVRYLLLALSSKPLSPKSLRDELEVVRDALDAGEFRQARQIVCALLQQLSFRSP